MKNRPVLNLLALLGTIALAAWSATLPIAWKNTSYYVMLPCFLLMLPASHRLLPTPLHQGKKRLLEHVPKPVQTVVLAGFLGIVLTHLIAVASLIGTTPRTQHATILALEKVKSCPMWTLQLPSGQSARLCNTSPHKHAVGQTVPVHVQESRLAYNIRYAGS